MTDNKLPDRKFICIHVDDAHGLLLDMTRMLAEQQGFIVFRCSEPWAARGKVSFSDEPPSVGELAFPEIENQKLAPVIQAGTN